MQEEWGRRREIRDDSGLMAEGRNVALLGWWLVLAWTKQWKLTDVGA